MALIYLPMERMGKREAKTILITGKNNAGFTLVELLLSVVVLSFGLVVIVGAYITAGGVLNSSQNRLQAVEFLQDKLSDIIQLSFEQEGLSPQATSEEVILNNRPATYNLEITPLQSSDDLDLSKELNSVKLMLSWKERNIERDVSISTYINRQQETVL